MSGKGNEVVQGKKTTGKETKKHRKQRKAKNGGKSGKKQNKLDGGKAWEGTTGK